jgi:hypothetical protein
MTLNSRLRRLEGQERPPVALDTADRRKIIAAGLGLPPEDVSVRGNLVIYRGIREMVSEARREAFSKLRGPLLILPDNGRHPDLWDSCD